MNGQLIDNDVLTLTGPGWVMRINCIVCFPSSVAWLQSLLGQCKYTYDTTKDDLVTALIDWIDTRYDAAYDHKCAVIEFEYEYWARMGDKPHERQKKKEFEQLRKRREKMQGYLSRLHMELDKIDRF